MPTMKALTIKNPSATYIILGDKTIEIRKHPTDYRGPLLIVSSARPHVGLTGHALGTVNLVDCREYRPEDAEAAKCGYCPEHYAWVLERPEAITPFPVKGRVGFYDVTIPDPSQS